MLYGNRQDEWTLVHDTTWADCVLAQIQFHAGWNAVLS